MLFSSPLFLFFFFPLVFCVYFIFKNNFKIRNFIIIFFSLSFYFIGEGINILVLLISILFNYYISSKIILNNSKKKNYLIFGLIFNLLLLLIFKYLNFFILNLNILFKFFSLNLYFNYTKIDLPVGISFFTFQSISLIVDVYKEKNIKKINLETVSIYISMFPQLVAGPIIRFNDIKNQFLIRFSSNDDIFKGLERFIIGLAKKVVIADSFGSIANDIYDDNIFDEKFSHLSPLMAWLGAIAFLFQIYYDFSGYSDMAIGLCRIFGFKIKENFNFPYSAVSITDFWRRWHISLSSWFKDYLYIPLGGNKVNIYRNYLNLFTVFSLCGLWHGASFNFIIWGLYHGFFISFEKFLKKFSNLYFLKFLNKFIFLKWITTLFIVTVGWVIFRSNSLSDAVIILHTMFDFKSPNTFWALKQFLNYELIFLTIISFVGLFDVYKKYFNLFPRFKIFYLFSCFIFSLIHLSFTTFNPFIYFRF